jgi:hypothetical protein
MTLIGMSPDVLDRDEHFIVLYVIHNAAQRSEESLSLYLTRHGHRAGVVLLSPDALYRDEKSLFVQGKQNRRMLRRSVIYVLHSGRLAQSRSDWKG